MTHADLRRCTACDGTGAWSGIWHEGACAQCGGAGVLDAEGRSLPPERAVYLLRTALNERLAELDQVRAELRAVRVAPDLAESVYPRGRYHGD